MSERRNIKVQQTEFDQLKADKPEGVSWGYYLTQIRTVDHAGELVDGE